VASAAETEISQEPADFQILLLGPFALYRRGELVDAPSWQRSALTLLKLLATAFEQRRLRDELIDVLWPDALPETGANNLRYVLSVLRRNLGGGDPAPVVSERGWIALNPAYCWDIDLVRFEELLNADGREPLEQAVRLYRGEPLADERYEDWAAPVRDRAQRGWRDACLRLAHLSIDAGEPEAAVSWLERVLAHDALDEEALRSLLLALGALGRRVEALRRFQQFEKQLRAELDVAPSEETLAVAAALRDDHGPAGRPALPPPETAAAQRPRDTALPIGAYLGSLPLGRMVGRQQELRRAQAHIDAVLEGEGHLMMVAGEPGVGKTRFAQEITGIVSARGFIVAAGRCYEIEQSTAYYPFLDALAAVYCAAPPSLLSAIPQRWPYLARLLPDYLPVVVSESGRSDEQQLLFRAVSGFLEAVSEVSPLAIMLDDLHWSDAGSLRLLSHICRHTRRSRVLLLGTYRNVEVGRHHPLERVLLDLAREELVERIVLHRLSPNDTAALIGTTLGEAAPAPEIVELILNPTEGNPFFIQQIVRSMVEQGELYRVGDRWQRKESVTMPVPESVRAAIGQRLSRLDTETQEILREASVLGQSFLFDDLQGMGIRLEDQLEPAVEQAQEYGLVHALGQDEYEFDHALTRQAIYGELSPHRRRKLHLAAAQALARPGKNSPDAERRAAEIAAHFLEGAEAPRAIPWSLLAGDRAEAVYAHDEAEGHYQTALELAHETGDRRGEAEALLKLGEVLIVVSRHQEALPLEQQAAELYRSMGDTLGEARAVTRIAWAHTALGTFDESIDLVRSMLARLEGSGPSRVLLDLHSALLLPLTYTHQTSESLAELDHLEELAHAVCYERYIASIPAWRGFHLLEIGRIDEALGVIERALPNIEAAGDLFSLANAVETLGFTYTLQGNLGRATELMERHYSIHLRRGDPTAIANALTDLTWIAFLRGDWSRARTLLDEALELVHDRLDTPLTALPMSALGYSRVLTGEHDGLVSYLEQCIAIAGGMVGLAFYAQWGLAIYDLLGGRPEATQARLESVLQHQEYRHPFQTMALPTLAEAYLMLNDLERAAESLFEASRRAERERNRLAHVEILLVRGMLLGRRDQWQQAERALEEGLAMAREIPLPFLQARILQARGRLRASVHDAPGARVFLAEALAIFRHLGARPFAEQTQRILAFLPRTDTP
jgi:DNA-binding SARP family transcriptional activator